MLMFGFLSFAVGTWWMTYLTGDWDFNELRGRKSSAASV